MQGEFQELFKIQAPGIQKKPARSLESRSSRFKLQQSLLEFSVKLNKNQEGLQSIDLNLESLIYLKETLEDRLKRLNQTLTFNKESESPVLALKIPENLLKDYETKLKSTSRALLEAASSLSNLSQNKKFLLSELETLRSQFISCLNHENEVQDSIYQLKALTIQSLKEQNALLRINAEKEIQQIESGYSILTPSTNHKLTLALNLTHRPEIPFISVFLLFLFTILIIKYFNFSI